MEIFRLVPESDYHDLLAANERKNAAKADKPNEHPIEPEVKKFFRKPLQLKAQKILDTLRLVNVKVNKRLMFLAPNVIKGFNFVKLIQYCLKGGRKPHHIKPFFTFVKEKQVDILEYFCSDAIKEFSKHESKLR